MQITHTTDLILLHRWRASRDAEAFRALAERYAGLVYAAAHRVLRDASEAEDVAQECFLTLAQARKPPERNLGAWLHAAAVNRAKNHIRGEVRRRLREQHYDALQPDRIQIELDDTLAHVDEAIAALDDELRHVIIAHFLEAKSQGEIADTTGVSRQTVNARVKRGIEAIREHLTSKGITATTASLTALLGAQMVEAAPASLLAALGKVALSGGTAAAGGGVLASMAGLLTTKVAVGLAAVLLAVVSLFAYQEISSETRAPVEHPAKEHLKEMAKRAPSAATETRVQESVSAPVEVVPVSASLSNGGRVLAGTILDEDGGLMKRPVTVYAHANLPADLKIDMNSPEGQRYLDNHIVRITEADDGVFELDPYTNPRTQGVIYASDIENHVSSEEQKFDLSSGDLRDITLRFHHYGAIAGTLLDKQGMPIYGAKVEFNVPGGSFEAHSDEHGKFMTAPLPPGEYGVRNAQIGDPFHPEQDYVELPVSNPNVVVRDGEHVDSVALVCNCELTQVSGCVVDEQGQAIPNLSLLLQDANIPAVGPVRVYRLSGVTDDHGKFDLSVYGPGIYKLDVVSSDYELPEPITVRSGEVNLELHARIGGKKPIRFRFVDVRTGKRVESSSSLNADFKGPNVKGENWHWESGGPLVATMSVEEATDSTATFVSPGVGAATYPIKLSDLGGPEILIRLLPVSPIEGQVLDSEGNPKPNVRVQDSWSTLAEPRTRTDADGRFQLANLNPGQMTIYLFSDDAPQMQVPIERNGEWVVHLPRGATISGTVTASGEPMKGLEMELWTRAVDVPGDVRKKAYTDAEGRYEFRGVATGTGTVRRVTPAEKGSSILGPSQQEITIPSDETITVDFSLNIRTADASLRGMMYADGQPFEGRVNVRLADGEGSDSRSSGDFSAAQGFRIDDLVSGDVVIDASRGRCARTFSHRLTPGENTLDIQFSGGGAILDCTFPILPERVDSVQAHISVDTEFGEESMSELRLPFTQTGVRVNDLPEGTATVRFVIFEKGSGHTRNFERTVELVSGNITSVNFGGDGASLNIAVSGVQESDQIVLHLLPGRPTLPDIHKLSPTDFAERLSSLQPVATLEMDDLDQPIKDLDAGVYTIFGFAVPVQGVVAVTENYPPGFRTVQAEVTLEPETEAQVTLAFP